MVNNVNKLMDEDHEPYPVVNPPSATTEISFDPNDVESRSDRRDEVPDIIPYLLPGEIVVHVEQFDLQPSHTSNPVSVIKAIHRLSNTSLNEDVGQNGPVVAAISTPENGDVEELQLFDVLFGRDSLRVALDLLDRYPRLAHATIVKLAELQGFQYNERSGEEPGRILHEFRDPSNDERARSFTAERGWEWPYYESIDATPLFITAIKRYCKQEGPAILSESYVGRDGAEHTIGDYFQKSLDWMTQRMETSKSGFLEFKRIMGVDPETWKDSWDSFSHEDGTIANLEDGIASVEVQALAYDALIDAATVQEKWLHNFEEGAKLRKKADTLKQRIVTEFWVEDDRYSGGYFAQGLDYGPDGNLRQIRTRTSDMGHLLNSRLLDDGDPDIERKRAAIIHNLFSDDMLNASGIRTLAKNEKRFRPGGYHTGSVWLWDTYYIAQGLERQGYYGLSHELKKRIHKIVEVTNLLPEFAHGGDDPQPRLNTRIIDVWDPNGIERFWENGQLILKHGRINRIEQPPQEIQAWTVAAILSSKLKRDPLHPDREIPLQANDTQKRLFEQEVIANLPMALVA